MKTFILFPWKLGKSFIQPVSQHLDQLNKNNQNDGTDQQVFRVVGLISVTDRDVSQPTVPAIAE